MTCLLIFVVAVAEAIVYQQRYRATHGTPLAAGFWTLLVCALRVGFVALGVSAVMRDQWVWALVCYAVPAAIVTGVVRWVETRKAGEA